jgi:response regulator RpfG family c-di-GMP phosphodiesterase
MTTVGEATTGWTRGSGVPPADLVAAAAERAAVASTLLEISRVFTECLAVAAPDVRDRTVRVATLVMAMVERLRPENAWEFEVAARLSQVGCLAIAAGDRAALARGEGVSEDLARAFASHPLAARDLLTGVRTLAGVREMVARQHEPYAVAGAPSPGRVLDRVTLGAQVLRLAGDAEALASAGLPPAGIARVLGSRHGEYHPTVLAVLLATLERHEGEALARAVHAPAA